MIDQTLSYDDLNAVQELTTHTMDMSDKQFETVAMIDGEAIHRQAHRILEAHAEETGVIAPCASISAALIIGIMAERQRQARLAASRLEEGE